MKIRRVLNKILSIAYGAQFGSLRELLEPREPLFRPPLPTPERTCFSPRKSRDDHVKARRNVDADALYDRRRRTRAAPVAEGRAAKASPLPSAGCTLRGRRASDPAAAAAEPARRESPRIHFG